MSAKLRAVFARPLRAAKGIAMGLSSLPGYLTRKITYRNRPVAIILSVGGPHAGSGWITERAARLGFRPVVVAQEIPFREMRNTSGWVRLDAATQSDQIIDVAKRLDAKLVLSDHRNYLLKTAADVQAALGVRALGPDGPRTSNDKFAFREALDAAGAPNLKWARLSGAAKAPLQSPFIAKPTRGTGSRGVMKISDESDLDNLWKIIAEDTEDRGWIGEEYIPARQFDVEGVVRDGEMHVLSVTEEHYEETAGKFPSSWFLFSPPVPQAWLSILHDTARSTLQACGVRNGAFHCEMRLTDEMRCVPIDYSNRYGYPMMVSACADVDFVEYYARTLVGAPFVLPEVKKNAIFQQYATDLDQREAYKRLIQDNPGNVIEARMLGSLVGGVQTHGRVSLKTDSYADMSELLGRYGLRPEIWDRYYPGS